MSNYYKERKVILNFLDKYEKANSLEEKARGLIRCIDINTLKVISLLDLTKLDKNDRGDIETLINFVKTNQKEILQQLDKQNLFYARINIVFAPPTFAMCGAILSVGLMNFACPPLALVLDVLFAVAAICSFIAVFAAIKNNLHKKELYQDIAKMGEPKPENPFTLFSSRSVESRDWHLNCSTIAQMMNVPVLLGASPL